MKNAAYAIGALVLAASIAFGVITRKDLSETTEALENERTTLVSIEKELEATRLDRQKSTRELNETLAKLRNELETAKVTEIETRRRLQVLEEECQRRTEMLRTEIALMETERDETASEISSIRGEYLEKTIEMENLLRRCRHDVEVLEGALSEAQVNTDEIQSQAALEKTLMKEEAERLREKLQTALKNCEAVEQELTEYKTRCQKRIYRLNEKITAKDQEIASLYEALTKLDKENSRLEDKIISLTETWETRLASAKKEMSKLSGIEKQRDIIELTLEEVRKNVRITEKKYDSVKAQLADTFAELKAKEEARLEIEAELEKENARSLALADKCGSLEKELERLEEEKAIRSEYCRSLEARLEEARLELEAELEKENARSLALADKCGSLEKELERLEEEKATRSEYCRSLEARLEEARERTRMAEKKYDSVKEQLVGIFAELKAKEKTLQELETALDEERKTTLNIREKCEKEVENLKSACERKDDNIVRLNAELTETLGAYRTLEKKIMDTSSTMEELRLEMIEVRKNVRLKELKIESVKKTYENLVLDLQQELERKEITIEQIKGMITIEVVDSILFPAGRAAITPEGERVLQKVGDVIKTIEDRMIRVVGHTDNIPIKADYRTKYPTNWELSAARACSVVRFFQHRMGLHPSLLEPVGKSFYDPVAPNDTADGRSLNRRVTITIGPPLKLP